MLCTEMKTTGSLTFEQLKTKCHVQNDKSSDGDGVCVCVCGGGGGICFLAHLSSAQDELL